MKIQTKKLLELCKRLSPGLSRNSMIEQEQHFVFTKEYAFTFNEKKLVYSPAKTDLNGSINAEIFLKILSGCGEEVELSTDGSFMSIQSENLRSKVAFLTEDQLISDAMDIINQRKEWKRLPRSFTEAVGCCGLSVSGDITQDLGSVCVSHDKVISCDGYRATVYHLPFDIGACFLVPGPVTKEIGNYLFTRFALTEAWIFLKDKEGFTFSFNRIQTDYPIKPILEPFGNFKGHELMFPEELVTTINTVSVLSEGEFDVDRVITMCIQGSKVKCRGEGSQGWAETVLPVTWTGKDITFQINPVFLQQILQSTRTATVADSAILFRGKNFEHIVALMSEGEEA